MCYVANKRHLSFTRIYGPVVDAVGALSAHCQPGCLLATSAVWPHLVNRASFSAVDNLSPCPGIKLYSQQLQSTPPRAAALPQSSSHAHTSWDLCYTSGVLESSYESYFHRRSVPLDVTFLCIVILSQLTWIHKWEFRGSFLFPTMIALVSFNLACLWLVFSSRNLYLRWRYVAPC